MFDRLYFAPDDSTPEASPEKPTEETPDETPTDNGGKSFTQDDVNRIVANRLERARTTHRNEVLKELGFDSLKAAQAALTDRQTEIDKLKAQVQEYEDEKARLHAEKEAQEKEEKLKGVLAEKGVQHIPQALVLASADGLTLSDETLEDDIKALREKHAFLFQAAGSPDTPVSNTPADTAGINEDALKQISKRFGRF